MNEPATEVVPGQSSDEEIREDPTGSELAEFVEPDSSARGTMESPGLGAR